MLVVNCVTGKDKTVDDLREFLKMQLGQPITMDNLVSKGYLLVVTLRDLAAFRCKNNNFSMIVDSDAAFGKIPL